MLSLESVELLIIVLGLVRDMVPWSCNSMRALHGTATSLTDSPSAVGLKEAANVKCFLLLVMVFAAVLLPSAIATTMVATQLKCALCNETSEQIVLESSNTLGGSSDLDGRPPEMLRSTMDAWAHECPSCGYCSYRLDERIEGAERAIKDPAYIEILRDESMDTLTRRFLCLSKIHDAARENNNALEYALYATWTLDDANDQARAVVIRKAVINKLEPLIKSGQRFRDQTAADQLLASDIARRVGDFAKASAYASAGLELKPDADIEKMLRYELALVAKSDTQVHTIAEAVESPEIGDQAAEPREEVSAADRPKDGGSSGGQNEDKATSSISPERMAQINAKAAKFKAAGEAFKTARILSDNFDWAGARALYQQIVQDNPGSNYAATAEKQLSELSLQEGQWRAKRMHIYAWWPILQGKSRNAVRRLLGTPAFSFNSDNTWTFPNRAETKHSRLPEDLDVIFNPITGVVDGVKCDSVVYVFRGFDEHDEGDAWAKQVAEAMRDQSPQGQRRLRELILARPDPDN